MKIIFNFKSRIATLAESKNKSFSATTLLLIILIQSSSYNQDISCRIFCKLYRIRVFYTFTHDLYVCLLQIVYDKGEIYSFSKYGRFCHEIKMNYSPYTNYFTRVFWNRSYHVYKVNSVISFQYWLGRQWLCPSSGVPDRIHRSAHRGEKTLIIMVSVGKLHIQTVRLSWAHCTGQTTCMDGHIINHCTVVL